MDRRVKVRALVLSQDRRVPWWAWALFAAGLVSGMPSWGQGSLQPTSPSVVPEVVRPRGEAPSAGDARRALPDNGVIAPPVTGGGAVIRPPVGGVMPIIPPPGSAGGAGGVVPR